MSDQGLVLSLFIIFSGAAVLSTVALFTRQSLLVAYIILGMTFGPFGFGLVSDLGTVKNIGEVGIIFLLFLLGLHLPPQKLFQMLKSVSWIGAASTVLFWLISYGISRFFHFPSIESTIIAASMVFSSTIIGIKLLPTTTLHHKHTGELMISILLLQDLVAIAMLLFLHGMRGGSSSLLSESSLVLIGLPVMMGFAFLFERYVLLKLIVRFDRIREYMFLIAVAWCLGMAELAHWFGLSEEVGAFIAGVTLASSPIALYIAEHLKPIRDFFLVMFFFAVGASFDMQYLHALLAPTIVLTLVLMVAKPVIYRLLLGQTNEPAPIAWEVGVRLAQSSEFSLIIAFVAQNISLITPAAGYFIQATTILTFIISSYWVVICYPTPISTNERMRRD